MQAEILDIRLLETAIRIGAVIGVKLSISRVALSFTKKSGLCCGAGGGDFGSATRLKPLPT